MKKKTKIITVLLSLCAINTISLGQKYNVIIQNGLKLNSSEQEKPIIQINDIICNPFYCYGKGNNELYFTGNNKNGAGGNGTTENANVWTLSTSFPKNVKIKKLTLGNSASYALLENGDLYSVGNNAYGQLGLNTKTPSFSSKWVKVTLAPKNITDVIAGESHVFVKTSNGDYYGTGRNDYGQFGTGHSNTWEKWIKLTIPANTDYIATASVRSFAVVGNKLYGTGSNYYGQLGSIKETSHLSWQPIALPSEIKTIDKLSLAFHSSYILSNNNIYATGYNNSGELADGTTTQRNQWKKIENISNVNYIKAMENAVIVGVNDSYYGAGNNTRNNLGLGYTSAAIKEFTKINNIKRGDIFDFFGVFILKKENNLWYGNGGNFYGQLGIGTDDDHVLKFTKQKEVEIPTE